MLLLCRLLFGSRPSLSPPSLSRNCSNFHRQDLLSIFSKTHASGKYVRIPTSSLRPLTLSHADPAPNQVRCCCAAGAAVFRLPGVRHGRLRGLCGGQPWGPRRQRERPDVPRPARVGDGAGGGWLRVRFLSGACCRRRQGLQLQVRDWHHPCLPRRCAFCWRPSRSAGVFLPFGRRHSSSKRSE